MTGKPQFKHYGIFIPVEKQPLCPICKGFMRLHMTKGGTMQWVCLKITCRGKLLCGDAIFEGEIKKQTIVSISYAGEVK